MKKSKKLMALIVSTLLLVTMMAVPVSAAAAYTPKKGEKKSFKKYLVLDKDAEVPNVTFEFEISKGNAIPAGSGRMEVIAGPSTTTAPSIGTAEFTSSSTTYDTVQTGDTSVTLGQNQKYASANFEIDFTGVSFPEPGVYRYVITEKKGTAKGVTYDTDPKYLDVYIINDEQEANKLKIGGYVLHTDSDAPLTGDNNGTKGGSLATKIDGIQNSYGTHNLYVGKQVTGNQGSKDKYFKFTITVAGLNKGDKLSVDLTHASETVATVDANKNGYSGKDNPTEMSANNEGTATADVYLSSGEYVVIKGLPEGANYTVTEDEEDYKKTEKIAQTDSTIDYDEAAGTDAFSDAVSGSVGSNDIHTGFTNTRDGIIPTGILLSATPWIILGIVAVAGIIFFAIRSKKSYENE